MSEQQPVAGLPRPVIFGAVLTVALAAGALLGKAAILSWVALVPLGVGLAVWMARRGADTPSAASDGPARRIPPESVSADEMERANQGLRQQVHDLTMMREIMLAMGATFDRAQILDQMIRALTQLLHFDRGLVLVVDDKEHAVVFGAYSHVAPDDTSQAMLRQVRFDLTEMAFDSLFGTWSRGEPVMVTDPDLYAESRLTWAMTVLDMHQFYSVPLMLGTRFRGVVIADNSVSGAPISEEQQSLLHSLAAAGAVTLENAQLYQMTDEQLERTVDELTILSRIDRELNDALSVDRVLNLTVDWLLRFSGGQAAAVALVEPGHRLRYVTAYGYEPEQWARMCQVSDADDGGIAGRVARSGQPERLGVLPEGCEGFLPDTRSQMAVPVTRESRVVAVLIVESSRTSAFTESSENFALRLAARAAAAIENSRLFDETLRERRKLEIILGSTADAVIVVGDDGRLVLVNQAAMRVFNLPPKEDYAGKPFVELFAGSPLLRVYQRARAVGERTVGEVVVDDKRVFHASVDPTEQVGWSIVLHDVTPFKEIDQIKNELLATTSHDLKNPLGSILGYVDLITMTNALNPQGLEYTRRVQRAVHHMRNLIDDLLDMARIESGIRLNVVEVDLCILARDVVQRFELDLKNKQISLDVQVPETLPPVYGDERRLAQILGNLVSNAIKYTPSHGRVVVRAERRSDYFYVAVQDNGLGISPDDQAHIFSRFYRVRTPETQNIEGTGLGLAITKSLVEIHGGQVGLESRLGEGSTFYFTLPVTPPPLEQVPAS